MVDLVLQDTRVPTFRLQLDRFASFVKTIHDYGCATTNFAGKAYETQTSLKELNGFIADDPELRIDNHVEIDRLSLACFELLLRDIFLVFDAILYDGELERRTDLRRRQTYTGRCTHRVAHLLYQILNCSSLNFLHRQLSRDLPQNRITNLDNF